MEWKFQVFSNYNEDQSPAAHHHPDGWELMLSRRDSQPDREPRSWAAGHKAASILRRLGFVTLLLLGGYFGPAQAQTPSPLQEWQYSGGIILARLFEPNLPEWRVILGAAAQGRPAYDGSRAYRVEGGPLFDIRYRDIAFLSTGEGLGFNFLRGDHYQVGLAMAYDLGRQEKQDYANLRGMGNISAAPVAKLYGSWVLSRKFPMILRVDARQFIGGAEGAVGDAGVYLPLPGSSKTFVMFAGASITLATNHYLQTLYGVTPAQSVASGHSIYEIPHAGTSAAGVGFSATKFVTPHVLLNADAALNQIRGSPAHSPLVERRTQRALALSIAYNW
jgi:outer membrane scaffolding protein for murein synthesis (MipA/OmpV family)